MNTANSVTKTVQFLNIMAFVAVIVTNVLSNALPLNGRTAGEISDALPSFFTPAGYTFSIWGVIYLALLGFTVYQALPSQRSNNQVARIGLLFVVSSIFNVAWLFAWHYGFYVLSMVFMASLLLSLIAIYARLNIGRPAPQLSWADRLLVHLPFSLYMGWITVATIANVASVTTWLGWEGFGIAGPVWSAIMMGVAVVVAGLLLFNRADFAYAGVLIWSLFGIRSAFPEIDIIANTAVIAAAAIAILAIIGWYRTRKQQPERVQIRTA